MRITCVLVVIFAVFKASALSYDNGFGCCDSFNFNGGCACSLTPSAVQSPIIDEYQYRLFDFLTKQTGDSTKAGLKPPIRKDYCSTSPLKRFSQPSSLSQNIPTVSGNRNFELPAFQFFPSSSFTSGLCNEAQPTEIERTGNGIFSTNRAGSVNIERIIGGGLGSASFPEVLNEGFLGNSNGAMAGIDSSFPGSGSFLEGSQGVLSGSSPSFTKSTGGVVNVYSNEGY